MKTNEFLAFMDKVKIYDLTQRLSIHTPPWPSYMPLQIQYFKRLAGDPQQRLVRTIGDVPLPEWYGQGVVVDISQEMEDYDLYSPELLESKVEIKEGDILIINTGYHRFAWDQPESDELRYFVRHPGPNADFHQWALDKKIKWIGVDCGSADHPMNTIIRDWHPKPFKQAEARLIEKYGKKWDEMFPPEEFYQVMHLKLFPKGLVHAENLGGEIEAVSNKRLWIGLFPLRGIELESSMCRIVAMEPPEE